MTKVDLQSSIKEKGQWVTEIIHSVTGIKRTIEGVNTHSIRQGQFTKFDLRNGSYILVNDANVLLIEVFPESDIPEPERGKENDRPDTSIEPPDFHLEEEK